MTMLYTEADIKLTGRLVNGGINSNDAYLELSSPGPGGAGRINSATTARVQFQFPPKIVSDSRECTWRDQELPGNDNAVALAMSSSRSIILNWAYIVDGNFWSVTKVSEMVRLLRSYFVNARLTTRNVAGTVAYLKLWAIGGDERTSIRFKSLDIKHSETIVMPLGPRLAYPLRTDINAHIKLYTALSTDANPATSANSQVTSVGGQVRLTPDWF